jgi:serine/threonine protein kinase
MEIVWCFLYGRGRFLTKDVAIKMPNPDSAARAALRHECDTMNLLSNMGKRNHLVPLIGWSPNPDSLHDVNDGWLVMKLMKNGSLLKFLSQTPGATMTERINWCIQCVDAVHFLHTDVAASMGGNLVMLHRDIKPANFFVDEDLTVKIGQ